MILKINFIFLYLFTIMLIHMLFLIPIYFGFFFCRRSSRPAKAARADPYPLLPAVNNSRRKQKRAHRAPYQKVKVITIGTLT